MHVIRRRCLAWRMEVSPCGRDERATAVRQDEDEMQLIVSMGPAQHGQGSAFKWMMRASDRNGRRETFEVGSVWLFPSIRSRTLRC
jgi:hypothetical protein